MVTVPERLSCTSHGPSRKNQQHLAHDVQDTQDMVVPTSRSTQSLVLRTHRIVLQPHLLTNVSTRTYTALAPGTICRTKHTAGITCAGGMRTHITTDLLSTRTHLRQPSSKSMLCRSDRRALFPRRDICKPANNGYKVVMNNHIPWSSMKKQYSNAVDEQASSYALNMVLPHSS
jgi:hypothetical protein